jgi:hypothetical protein
MREARRPVVLDAQGDSRPWSQQGRAIDQTEQCGLGRGAQPATWSGSAQWWRANRLPRRTRGLSRRGGAGILPRGRRFGRRHGGGQAMLDVVLVVATVVVTVAPVLHVILMWAIWTTLVKTNNNLVAGLEMQRDRRGG